MRLAFLIPAVIVFISPASAEWQVRTYIDPMTDRSATVATLPAVAGQGTLRVACLNGRQNSGDQLSHASLVPPHQNRTSFR